MTFEQDLEQSADAFASTVYPEISHWFDGAKYVSIECLDDAAAEALDMGAGIDGLIVHEDYGVRGVAARVHDVSSQGRCWSTVTHRYERESGATTEHEKRRRAIENRNMTPYLTIQGYVDDVNADEPELLDALACRTRDLITLIDEGSDGEEYDERYNPDPTGAAYFYSVEFENIEKRYPAIRLGDGKPDDPWHAFERNCPNEAHGCPGPKADSPAQCLECGTGGATADD